LKGVLVKRVLRFLPSNIADGDLDIKVPEIPFWITGESAISRLGLFREGTLSWENFMKQSKIRKGFSPNTYVAVPQSVARRN
jgi:hypothetical protein